MTASGPHILVVAGTRPNFIKVAPLLSAFEAQNIPFAFLHSRQHYEDTLSEIFFQQLGIPAPDYFLNVAEGSPAARFANLMQQMESAFEEINPAALVVAGDVDTTLAAALVARKQGRFVMHIESGLRSFDRRMPEEINRIITDSLSDVCYTTSESAKANLLMEGIPEEKIVFAGNIMVDTLLQMQPLINRNGILKTLGIKEKEYILVTLHRPGNVDTKTDLEHLMKVIRHISTQLKVVFPIHPRTRKRLVGFNLWEDLAAFPGIQFLDPLGYLEFSRLLKDARIVLTDSGGIQEESTVYGIPCITLRENTERPETLDPGSSVLAGSNARKIDSFVQEALEGRWKKSGLPTGWDGKAATRIALDVAGRIPEYSKSNAKKSNV